MKPKQQKQREAAERQARHRARTSREQIQQLDARPGQARRERQRMAAAAMRAVEIDDGMPPSTVRHLYSEGRGK